MILKQHLQKMAWNPFSILSFDKQQINKNSNALIEETKRRIMHQSTHRFIHSWCVGQCIHLRSRWSCKHYFRFWDSEPKVEFSMYPSTFIFSRWACLFAPFKANFGINISNCYTDFPQFIRVFFILRTSTAISTTTRLSSPVGINE